MSYGNFFRISKCLVFSKFSKKGWFSNVWAQNRAIGHWNQALKIISDKKWDFIIRSKGSVEDKIATWNNPEKKRTAFHGTFLHKSVSVIFIENVTINIRHFNKYNNGKLYSGVLLEEIFLKIGFRKFSVTKNEILLILNQLQGS